MPEEVQGPFHGTWSGGWHPRALALASPNHGPRPGRGPIDLIVLHAISLPPGQYGGPHVPQFFMNQLDWTEHPYFLGIQGMQVSAHFLIRRTGELLQFVSCDDRAWHAGASCYRGRANCNDDSIGIELEGLEGGPFEPKQYATLAELCTELVRRYPLITHIAGHEHIAPGRKADPGPGFDWTRLQQSLGALRLAFPAQLRCDDATPGVPDGPDSRPRSLHPADEL